MHKIPKDYMAIIDPFLKTGQVKLVDGSRHAAIVRPDGHKQFIPGTPSDHRALLNFKSQVRRFINSPTLS